MPEEPIFTMHHHIPDNWLIEPVQSIYDLDNIKLATVDGSGVHSEFELEHLLLEGKVEKILKDSLNSIPSPSPPVKIQIIDG